MYIDFPFKVSDDEKIFLSKDECENYIKELDDVKYYDVKDQIGYNLTEKEMRNLPKDLLEIISNFLREINNKVMKTNSNDTEKQNKFSDSLLNPKIILGTDKLSSKL